MIALEDPVILQGLHLCQHVHRPTYPRPAACGRLAQQRLLWPVLGSDLHDTQLKVHQPFCMHIPMSHLLLQKIVKLPC